MRVGLVCPYSVSYPGGVQTHVMGLAGELTRRGHIVRVLAPCDGPPPSPLVDSVGQSIPLPANGSVARLALTPLAWRQALRWSRRRALDVVHVHEPFAPMASLALSARSRVPLVGTFHAAADHWWPYDRFGHVLGLLADRLSARTAVSDAAEALAARHFDGPFARTPNGIDLAPYASASPHPDPPDVLFVGRLEPRKGAFVMVEAARILGPSVRVALVGDGGQRLALEASAPPNVSFLGTRTGAELASLLTGCKVFAAPSLGGESFGFVVLEAMAAGAVVVASAIPGYAAVLGDGGHLVPPGDAAALAAAISTALCVPSDLGARARERAAEFSWERLAGHVEEIYESVI